MSCNVWTPRKDVWRKGYRLFAYELMNEYYDWEEDPMCDCCPAQKYRKSLHKWEINVYKTYAYREGNRNYVATCHEIGARLKNIPEDMFNALWEELTTTNVPFNALKARFEDEELKAEAIRLIP